MLAEVSYVPDPVVWQALIAAVVTLALAWMNQRTKNAVDTGTSKASKSADDAADKAVVAAAKVAEVKTTLDENTARTDEKLQSISKTTEAVHVLVNSSMSAQLKISMIALHRVAELTHHPEDIAAADLAEKLFREHEEKQKTLDSMKA